MLKTCFLSLMTVKNQYNNINFMISDVFSKALNVILYQLSNFIEIMQRKGNDDGTMPQ